MNALQTDIPHTKHNSSHTIPDYIEIVFEGFLYSLLALSIYAVPMAVIYGIFHLITA